jgi:PAS domain S-box-containing protein
MAAPEKNLIFDAGVMAGLVRERDWAATPLGPIERWSAARLTAVNMMLACRFPSILFFGPELIMLYNDGFRRLMDGKHPEALGSPAQAVWQEAWHLTGPQIEQVFATGSSMFQEEVLVPVVRGGQIAEVWWTYNYSPVFETDGTIAGVFVIAHDVTSELSAKHERQRVAEQLQQVLEATTDAVMMLDREFRFTYANPRAMQIVAPVTDLLGKVCWQLFPHMVYEGSPYEEHYRRAMHEGIPGEFEAFYPDPFNIWLRVQVRPSKDGIVVFFRDVTAEHRILREREMLYEDRQQFFTLCESSTDFIGIADMEAKPFYGNPAALKLLGIDSLDAFEGGDLRRLFFPEDQEFILQDFLPRVRRDASADVEIRFRHFVTGEPIWVDYRVFLLRGATGQPIGYATVSHDLTVQKQTAEALIKTEKLAAVGRLAASIAHEINNPLESVTNLLYLSKGSDSLAESRHYLDTAERELRRVSAIANQTLRFHKQASKPEPVDCRELIESVLSIYQGRIVNSGIKVTRRDRTTSRLTCFDGEIRQVLSNLIGNAIDAMPQGEGQLVLRTRSGLEWATNRRGMVLTVADNGTGIGEVVVKRIFDPFFTTKGFAGTGLGLWVSHEIVARHQGRLQVRSKPGQGTVFRLFLPYEAARRDRLIVI